MEPREENGRMEKWQSSMGARILFEKGKNRIMYIVVWRYPSTDQF
jgi:hypothetical protein